MATLLRIVGILLALTVLLVVGTGISLYVYLAPEPGEPPLSAPGSVRTLAQGELIGAQDAYATYTWKGIPFAAPPVGNLRWRAPAPAANWAGRLEALNFASQCPQMQQGTPGPQGSEDCLYLNLWTPIFSKVPVGTNRLPVMVWIHGGGNSVGSAATSLYNGAWLAGEHDVIVVSIHYRLGPLGWFRHPALVDDTTAPTDASGNFGTLDIVAALGWVKHNIGAFGGDPGNVTIFGESAGGFNVLSMMASPLANGLFHRAISQSGGLSMTDPVQGEAYADQGGHRLSSREVVNQMLVARGDAANRDAARALQSSVPAAEIAALLRGAGVADVFAPYGGGFGGMLGNPDLFADGHVLPAGENIFSLFESPGTYNAVPVILGTNRNETKLFTVMGDATEKLWGTIPRRPVDPLAWERDNAYGSDLWKARAVDELAERLVVTQRQGVFAYRFDVDEWRNFGLLDLKPLLGAAHAMEIPFVFGNFPKPFRIVFPGSRQDEFDLISASMASYWTAFARDGDPGTGVDGNEARWPAWGPGAHNLMTFDTENDGGVRVQQLRMLTADIKRRFLQDTTYPDALAKCDAYRSHFRGENFDEVEYASVGPCEAVN